VQVKTLFLIIRIIDMSYHILQPETLNEISLKQYQVFLKDSENIEGHFLNQRMVSLFCGLSLSETLMIKKSSIDEVVHDINQLFEGDQPLQQRFKIGKVEFGFIPSLEDMSFGEFVDLDTTIGNWDNMHEAMAVMFRPITQSKGDKYDIEPYEGLDKYKDIMRFAPLGVVFGATLFFWNLSKELLRVTQASLVEELEREISQAQHSLGENGDGTQAFMHLQEEDLRKLLKSLPNQLESALHSSHLSRSV